MVKNNPFHRTIGELLGNKIGEYNTVKDPTCGGNHKLRLFLSENTREDKCCDVDLLLFKDKKVKVIIEIEETGIEPTKVCGKFLASAISHCCITKPKGDLLNMSDSVLFIQIINKLGLTSERRIGQFERIEQSINKIIPTLRKRKISKMMKYELFHGGKEDFESKEKGEGKKLINCIKEFIGDKK